MRRRNLDVLIAWLDGVRRRDPDAMRALLAPDASWQGLDPELRCSTPDEIVARWVAAEVDDLESLELTADDRRAALHARSPAFAERDPRLRHGLHIGFEVDGDGRIARIVSGTRRSDVLPTDADATPRGVPEAPVVDGRPEGEGWFVVNVADAPWKTGYFGGYTVFENRERAEARFPDLGFNIGVVEPGQPACWYHREGDQEDFLVLRGEALLLIEGSERRLRAWDFVHCPPWTEHVFVGAGADGCTVLAVGGRVRDGVVYPASELALRHRAGVREQVTEAGEPYAGVPDDVDAEFDPRWLPGR